MTLSRTLVTIASLLTTAVVSASGSPAQQVRAFEDVVGELKSPDADVRLGAVRQLGAAGHPEAALPLAPLLADPDGRVARAAMYAELGIFLGERTEPERRVARIFEVQRSNPAWRAFEDPWGSLPLMPVPAEIVERLAGRLAGEDVALRVETAYALAVLGQVEGAATPAHEKAADALADRLADRRPVIRAAAARAAGRLYRRCAAPCDGAGAVRLGNALVRGLNDPEPPVLMAMIEGLREMRYAGGVEALTRVYEHFGKEPPALAALDALARIGSASSVPLFKTAATRREPAARRAALEGLARANERDALGTVAPQAQAGHPNAEVILGAAFALQRAGLGQHLSPLLNAAGSRDTALQVQDYLVELGTGVAPQVAAALSSAAGEARARLIEVLAIIGGADAVPAIQAGRTDGNPRVARAADRALRRLAAFGQ